MSFNNPAFPLIGPAGVAERLKISVLSAKKLMKSGDIPVCWIGRNTPRVDPEILETLSAEILECYQQNETKPETEPEKISNPESYVYFIKAGDFIKIGYSEKSPERRLKEMQTASPLKLEIIVTLKGNRNKEKELHCKFRHLREQGEWFRAAEELKNFINTLNELSEAGS